eukprot:TCONS_00002892-protein
MLSRKCSSLSIVGFICCMVIIGYAFLTLQETQKLNEIKDHEIIKSRDHESVLKEQLKVVYHHAQKVEEELKKERERHRKTRIEFLEAKKEFYSNLTKSKHEAWTRFKALDSDHKMLKAEHEETKISYTSLQAQYKRLSADHQRIVKQSKDEYNTLKDNKDRESTSLQDRVQELYRKNLYYQEAAEKHRTYGKQMKEHYENCTILAEQLKKRLDTKYVSLKKKDSILPTNELKATQSTTEKSSNNVMLQPKTDNPANTKSTENVGDDDQNVNIGNHRYAGKAEDSEIANNHRYGNLKSNNKMKGDAGQNPALKDVTSKTVTDTTSSPPKESQFQNNLIGKDKNQKQEMFHQKDVQHPQLELPGGKPHDSDVENQVKNPHVQLELPGGENLNDNALDRQRKDTGGQIELPGKDNQDNLLVQRRNSNGQVELPGNNAQDLIKQRQNLNVARQQDETQQNERLDVKKVTMEDDENGDQNLDKDGGGGAGVEGAGEQKETGNENDPPIKLDEDETEDKMVDEDEEKK